MSANEIPESVKNFIFLHVDSVEVLEILLLFFQAREKSWSAQSVADELRSHPGSAERRILFLENLGLLKRNPDTPGEFLYDPQHPDLNEVVTELANAYRVRRHTVFELIFSPMKRARDFADAFRRGKRNPNGGENG